MSGVSIAGGTLPCPLPVTIEGGSGGLTDAELRASPVAISGTVTGAFYQTVQPVSGPLTDSQLRASSVQVVGPLTDTQLRATAVPVSGTVGISGTIPVSGTFFQATQPVSIAATVAVSGPLTDTQLRASAVAVSQSGTWTLTAPTLTKGTQGSTGFSTQDLKDAGRVLRVFSAAFTAATTEALVTLTPITDGTAGSTGTSFTVTSGKRLRLQSLSVTTKNAGAAAQGVVCNLRMTASGAVSASSPLITTCAAGTSLATANVTNANTVLFPDGMELSGTSQFGISQIGTATAGNTVTLIGYEY